MKLSDTQRVILSEASQHERLLAPLPKLPKAAANAVLKSLLKHELLAECTAPREHIGRAWRQDESESWIALRITDAGLRAIGVDPNEGDAVAGEPDCSGIEGSVPDTAPTGAPDAAPQELPAEPAEANQAAPLAQPRASLRDAATALVQAWDAVAARGFTGPVDGHDDGVAAAIEQLRAALATKPTRTPRDPGAPRKPREGTKQEAVLAMLRRPEGATVAQIAEAMAWEQHTVRGFFAGLKRKGITVVAAERIRQVGPNKEGAKGSYTIYRVEG
jgi:hypothetical protein